MEIRTKHLKAGFEAGLKGLKALEIGANHKKVGSRSPSGGLVMLLFSCLFLLPC